MTVVLAILESSRPHDLTAQDWQNLKGGSLYFQLLDNKEGEELWPTETVYIFVWESETALKESRPPVLLMCELSSINAGPESERQGTNKANRTIAGFEGIVWDETQLSARLSGRQERRRPVVLESGTEVNVYDFQFPTPHPDSQDVDKGIRPNYQLHLEVRGVRTDLKPLEFAVAKSNNSATLRQIPGYLVSEEQEKAIKDCLRDKFKIDLRKARALPTSSVDQERLGLRISNHPLHETFIRIESGADKQGFYRNAKHKSLVADIDAIPVPTVEDECNSDAENLTPQRQSGELFRVGKPLERRSRVYTMPLDEWLQIWNEACHRRSETPQKVPVWNSPGNWLFFWWFLSFLLFSEEF